MSQIVTLGAHHCGSHVDWLMALADRCGAQVVRVPGAEEPADTDGLDATAIIPVTAARRIPYAGKPSYQRIDEVRP